MRTEGSVMDDRYLAVLEGGTKERFERWPGAAKLPPPPPKIAATKRALRLPQEDHILHALLKPNTEWLGEREDTWGRYRTRRLRSIMAIPTGVFDAPELRNDFYLNILDWSPLDVIAIALNCAVYTYDGKARVADYLVSSGNDANYISAVRFLDRGASLAVANSAGCISVLDMQRKQESRRIALPEEGRIAALESASCTGMPFSEALLYAGCKSGAIYAYDLRTRARQATALLKKHHLEVCGLRRASDSWQLASGGNDNRVLIWDIRQDAPLYAQDIHRAAVKALCWSPHQRHVLATGAGTADKYLRVWNTATNKCLHAIDTGSQICGAVWSRTESELVTAHGYIHNELTIWHYPSFGKVFSIKAHDTRILHLAPSPDGTSVVTSAANENLKFWDLYPKPPLGLPIPPNNSLDFSR